MCMILMKKIIESNRIQFYKTQTLQDFVIPGPNDQFKEVQWNKENDISPEFLRLQFKDGLNMSVEWTTNKAEDEGSDSVMHITFGDVYD